MTRERSEEQQVMALGKAIGFGRTMQLCEQLWGDVLEQGGTPRGGAHSVGPCVAFLVPCPSNRHPFTGEHCDWCCGAGRVTERVAKAIADAGEKAEDK